MYELSTRAIRVLDHLRKVGTTTATNDELGAAIGAKTSTVRAAISELERVGLVDVERVKYTVEVPSGRIVTVTAGA